MDPEQLIVPSLVAAVVFGLLTLALTRPWGRASAGEWTSGITLLVAYLMFFVVFKDVAKGL